MRITVDLPAWADERHIYIFAGVEMAAFKPYGQDSVYVKTARCENCGNCCQGIKGYFPFSTGPGGKCYYRGPEAEGSPAQTCLLGAYRPFACATWNPPNLEQPDCAVKFKKVEREP